MHLASILRACGLAAVLLSGPGIMTATAQPFTETEAPSATPPQETAGVWIIPLEEDHGSYAQVGIAAAAGAPYAEPIDIVCALRSQIVSIGSTLTVVVRGPKGGIIRRAEADVDLDVGTQSQTFRLMPEVLGPGTYSVEVHLKSNSFQLFSSATASIRKLSSGYIEGRALAAADSLARLRGFLAGQEPSNGFPYARARTAIASEILPRARVQLSAQNLLAADDIVSYIERTVSSVHAQLSLNNADERTLPIAEPVMATLRPMGGSLRAEDRPVFLVGLTGGPRLVENMAQLRGMGINYAVVYDGPPAFGAEAASAPGPLLENAAAAAAASNVALTLMLADTPNNRFPSVLSWASAAGMLVPPPDAPSPSTSAWLRDALQWAGEQDIVLNTNTIYKPVVRFEDEASRAAFIEHLQQLYGTRDDLNWSWSTRLRGFEEVVIDPLSGRLAYQYDRLLFARERGSDYVRALLNQQGVFGPAPNGVTFAARMFEEQAVYDALDYGRLSAAADMIGITAAAGAQDEVFAVNHPDHVMPYALLRSLAPERPLFNPELRLDVDHVQQEDDARAFTRTIVWESVMEGVGALSAWAYDISDEDGGRPRIAVNLGVLEGLGTAQLDLNRLATIIEAFQQAPARVGLLWSFSSRLRESSLYLKSLREAYGGVSFGSMKTAFITEDEAASGALDQLAVLVLPDVNALSGPAFEAVERYISEGGIVVRTPNQISYDGRGHTRREVIISTLQTLLVRRGESSTAYLDAMESAYATGRLENIPRLANEFGYLLEGVKTRYAEHEGEHYLYAVNIRKTPVRCHLLGEFSGGRNLILGQDMRFPAILNPLEPILLRLDRRAENTVVIAGSAESSEGVK